MQCPVFRSGMIRRYVLSSVLIMFDNAGELGPVRPSIINEIMMSEWNAETTEWCTEISGDYPTNRGVMNGYHGLVYGGGRCIL